MRKTRSMLLGVAGETNFYHVVTRIVDRRKVMGDAERERLLKMLRRQIEFSGLRAIAWCFMGNHFHLLLEVPDKDTALEGWDEEQLLNRLKLLASEEHTRRLLADVAMWRQNENTEALAKVAESVRARLFDLSAFMKELKQRFSIWFNKTRGRCGTLWEDRFRSTLVERGAALRAVAAYIDLNPIRAGLAEDPKDYRWCSYAAAIAGDENARAGLRKAAGVGSRASWRGVGANYRKLLYDRGEARRGALTPQGQRRARQGFSRKEVEEVMRRGGKLPLRVALRCRIGYFTQGVALGSEGFLEIFFKAKRGSGLFGKQRHRGSRAMKGAEWGELRTMRNLSVGLTIPGIG